MSTRQPKGRHPVAGARGVATFAHAVQAAGLVCVPGKGAVEGHYRGDVVGKVDKTQFTGSVDMDATFRATEGQVHRWDYGLGVQPPGRKDMAVWVEPHPASSHGEVKVMLSKLDWLKAKLDLPAFAQLKALTDECAQQGVRPYRWMASGHVGIRPGSREANMLSLAGMDLPKSRVVI